MSMRRALQAVFALALAGVLFSGTLTYREFFGSGCASCRAPGAPGTIFGYPACVYGLVMYLAIFAIAAAGLVGRPSSASRDAPDR